MEKLALPPMKGTGPPAATPFVRNCAAPVGNPLPGETTDKLAVKVTLKPLVEGFCEEVTVVIVDAGATVNSPSLKCNT